MDPINTVGLPGPQIAGINTPFNGPYSMTPTTGVSGGKEPGKEEFLQLLVAQLRHQDPLKPMEDKEFITQLAQFNALAEMQKLNASFTAFSAVQDVQVAQGLLGKTVDYTGEEGTIQTGQVTELGLQAGIPKLTIGDEEVDLKQIVSVR